MEKYLEVESGKLWTKNRGQGTPVLLISGGPGCCNYMEPVAELIDGFSEVIMFDPRGCGRSTFDGNGYNLDVALRDLETIRLEYGIEKWVVIGHSWGADLGLAYSLEYPESIISFVSISGTGIQNDREWKEAYKRNKDEIGEVLPDFEYEASKIVHRSLIDSWRAYIKRPSLLKEIAELDLPTIFIFAENDIRPSWPIEQVANLIRNSRYIELVGAKHYIWQTKRKELGVVLREYIKTGNFVQE